jgi:hypothetical protein
VTPIKLTPHPSHPTPETATPIQITVLPTFDGATLTLTYRIVGDTSFLNIPEHQLAPDKLWQHTCCEVFFALPHTAPGDKKFPYIEYNFSPTGQWAGYAFAVYRQRLTDISLPQPHMRWELDNDLLLLTATVAIPENCRHAPLKLALSVVLEDKHGGRSYWAVKHPADRPDFHHPKAFAVIAAPTS